MCIFFSPIEAANVDQNKIINLLYDSKNSTDKDFILPDVGVSVKTAFFILCKLGKMSLILIGSMLINSIIISLILFWEHLTKTMTYEKNQLR